MYSHPSGHVEHVFIISFPSWLLPQYPYPHSHVCTEFTLCRLFTSFTPPTLLTAQFALKCLFANMKFLSVDIVTLMCGLNSTRKFIHSLEGNFILPKYQKTSSL